MGEICNACVLLVKRWKKLPKGSQRHWAHVVDARAGPGTKSMTKCKKKEVVKVVEDKLRKKHVYKRKKHRARAPSPAILSDGGHYSHYFSMIVDSARPQFSRRV